ASDSTFQAAKGLFRQSDTRSCGASGSRAHEAVNAVVVEAFEAPGVHQPVQVRDGLAHGEYQLVQVELALEQGREQLGGRARRAARLFEQREALPVVLREGVEARM